MSRPQVQFQLFGRPLHLAGYRGPLIQGRANTSLAGPVVARTLSSKLDALRKVSIGCDLLKDQNSPVECVPLSSCHSKSLPVRGHLEHRGFSGCAISEVDA